MTAPVITLRDIAALAALANGILPADDRDAGAAAVQAGPGIAERMRRSFLPQVYVDGLSSADELARTMGGDSVAVLDANQMQVLLARLREDSPAFFRQLRADVCALYLSDPGVWQRIGFPGPSTELGGYPDFDQPQS